MWRTCDLNLCMFYICFSGTAPKVNFSESYFYYIYISCAEDFCLATRTYSCRLPVSWNLPVSLLATGFLVPLLQLFCFNLVNFVIVISGGYWFSFGWGSPNQSVLFLKFAVMVTPAGCIYGTSFLLLCTIFLIKQSGELFSYVYDLYLRVLPIWGRVMGSDYIEVFCCFQSYTAITVRLPIRGSQGFWYRNSTG